MSWFERLTGIEETSAEFVRSRLIAQGSEVYSLANGKSWRCGELQTPSVSELRDQATKHSSNSRPLRLREIIADVQDLHRRAENAGAMFQVASQFNLLEMTSPDVTPEAGIGIYEHDRTQGPACAIAAGAGTIYRHYFASVRGGVGQTADRQIDCLADLGESLGNEGDRLWTMRNGYALPNASGLSEISLRLRDASPAEKDRLRCALRIGLQWNTEVTLSGAQHRVSQAYCSALPVAYARHPASLWEDFARLVLEASYEATFLAAIRNKSQTGDARLFLTLLGGGAFGNAMDWMIDAIRRSLRLFSGSGLDIAIVSYGGSRPEVARLVADHHAA